MEILDAIEKRLFENPPTLDRLNLEMKAREARARVLELHEAPIRTDAVGKQGLLLQLLELDATVDDTIVLDDVASKMKKLIALIRQSVEALGQRQTQRSPDGRRVSHSAVASLTATSESLGSDARRGLKGHPTVKPTAMLDV